MNLAEVVKRLQRFAPLHHAGSWDNVGLLVEPTHPHVVEKILLTNDLTDPVLTEALKLKANLIFSYHPPLFSPFKTLLQRNWKERIVVSCLENRIAVYSPHTALDSVNGGVNDWLILPFAGNIKPIEPATEPTYKTPGGFHVKFQCPGDTIEKEKIEKFLELQVQSSQITSLACTGCFYDMNCTLSALTSLTDMLNQLEPDTNLQIFKLHKPPSPEVGMGRLSKLMESISLDDAVQKVKNHLGLSHIRLARAVNGNEQINSVAVCAGSGASVLRGVKANLLLTGEMSHHEVLNFIHAGSNVILCDHSNTERGFLHSFSSKLSSMLDNSVSVTMSSVDCDPLQVV